MQSAGQDLRSIKVQKAQVGPNQNSTACEERITFGTLTATVFGVWSVVKVPPMFLQMEIHF